MENKQLILKSIDLKTIWQRMNYHVLTNSISEIYDILLCVDFAKKIWKKLCDLLDNFNKPQEITASEVYQNIESYLEEKKD